MITLLKHTFSPFSLIWWYYHPTQNCSTEDASTRTRRDIAQSHTVSYGPIKRREVHLDKSTLSKFYPHFITFKQMHVIWSPSSFFSMTNIPALGESVPPVETFVLGGLLVVLLLITGVFGRLWVKSRRSYPAQEAQLTLSNIHHISEVAS